MLDPRTNEQFDILARVLLRCGLFAYLLLLLTVGIYLLAGDVLFRLNADIFGLSKHELDLIIYGCIVAIKLVAILFFLIPWLAIRLVLRKVSR
jgi:hypothetical protein